MSFRVRSETSKKKSSTVETVTTAETEIPIKNYTQSQVDLITEKYENKENNISLDQYKKRLQSNVYKKENIIYDDKFKQLRIEK